MGSSSRNCRIYIYMSGGSAVGAPSSSRRRSAECASPTRWTTAVGAAPPCRCRSAGSLPRRSRRRPRTRKGPRKLRAKAAREAGSFQKPRAWWRSRSSDPGACEWGLCSAAASRAAVMRRYARQLCVGGSQERPRARPTAVPSHIANRTTEEQERGNTTR